MIQCKGRCGLERGGASVCYKESMPVPTTPPANVTTRTPGIKTRRSPKLLVSPLPQPTSTRDRYISHDLWICMRCCTSWKDEDTRVASNIQNCDWDTACKWSGQQYYQVCWYKHHNKDDSE
ncbi:hypothetical protein Tdes44962_MAKER00250 [Teratosphaeria destructans]|uniref:Uncharacterized protein n=1 Tax=Teratosphaeria destructans TaxID=418781 RepID=A0A9W7SVF2_9PEZI|nr:hypothetical protein Tdes44962_MAKER00250 [Teratosphaeria destructans]